jgi:hypothetical protein
LQQFADFKSAHPAAIEYHLTGELEARLVLAAVIPALRLAQKDVVNAVDRFTIARQCNEYQTAIVHGDCLALFAKMRKGKIQQLYLSGIKISAPRRWD